MPPVLASRVSHAVPAIATFRIAIDRQTGNGIDFIPVKCFGTAAETHARYLTKERQIAITGRLAQSQWTDENGNRRARRSCGLTRWV